jgi:hypothetical protein
MIFEMPKCEMCKHKILGGGCSAFTEIPDEIYYNEIEHDKKIEGQKGDFIFEKKDEKK